MAYIDFTKLKGRVPLARVLEHYDLVPDLGETSEGYEGACPFCGSEAFKVNTVKNAWLCFGECKEKEEKNRGNILDFVARKEGVSIKTAAIRIAGWYPECRADANDHAVVKARSGKPTGEAEVHWDAPPLPDSQEQSAENLVERISPKAENAPLNFKLQYLDHVHPHLTETLGFQRETMQHFGVGYFAGKGLMHNRIVIPIHNKDGALVAYAGASVEDGTYKYPEKFTRELELYNFYRVAAMAGSGEPLILVADYFDVFRMYEAGYRQVVALPTETISLHQLSDLFELVGSRGMMTVFVSKDFEHIVELMNVLIGLFYVRLIRPSGTETISGLSTEEIQSLLSS